MLDTSCIRVAWHYPQRIINTAFGELIMARFLNLATNQPLSELKRPNPDNRDEIISLKGIWKQLDEVQIEKKDGMYVIVSGRVTNVDKWSTGELKRVTKITRSEIKLNPPFDGSIFEVKDLPEGANLGNDDNPSSGLRYQLIGGKAVPAFADFSDSAEGKWSGRSTVWIVTWLVVGLLLLFFALRYVWRHKQRGA
jgi:hypothetical protein